jgi:hypothetical protein
MKLLILAAFLMFVPVAAADTTPPELQQQCRNALNNDPVFLKFISDKLDLQIEQKTLDAHLDADHHIQKNEAHVIYAYAAMWIVAALFVMYLFMRQQGLKAEILRLRRDLDAAGKDPA